MTPEAHEVIKRKRAFLRVHVYIYYTLDGNLVSDDKYDAVSVELVNLQKYHGVEHGYCDDVFRDWTGATGMHLPGVMAPRLVAIAISLHERHK